MRHVLALAFSSLVLPASAAAQLGPPPDGLYEDFPAIFMQPSGPLAAPPTLLVRWVDVRTREGVTTVTFEPDARVVWRITWGPNGPAEKETLVDGEVWTRSRFDYDGAGHLASKRVTGPGAGAGLTYAYETDATTGEIHARTTTLQGAGGAVAERVELSHTTRGSTVLVRRDGLAARRDRYDADRRLLETRLFDDHGGESARITYVRDAHGALSAVRRRLGRHRGAADPGHPDPTLDSRDVIATGHAPIERHEALLLLGAPAHARDEGRGAAREIHADFADEGCWMNQTSGLTFDPTGLLLSTIVGCICGFCVDAALPFDASETATALARREHWTAGPWVRIDGAIDVTADHELLTPGGPRAARDLRVGDLVTASDGAPRRIASLELLPDDGLRLGVDVVTPSGVFSAGGLVFVSESARICDSD